MANKAVFYLTSLLILPAAYLMILWSSPGGTGLFDRQVGSKVGHAFDYIYDDHFGANPHLQICGVTKVSSAAGYNSQHRQFVCHRRRDRHDRVARPGLLPRALPGAKARPRFSRATGPGLVPGHRDPGVRQLHPLLDSSSAAQRAVSLEASRLPSPGDGPARLEYVRLSPDRFCPAQYSGLPHTWRRRLQSVRASDYGACHQYQRHFFSLRRRHQGWKFELSVRNAGSAPLASHGRDSGRAQILGQLWRRVLLLGSVVWHFLSTQEGRRCGDAGAHRLPGRRAGGREQLFETVAGAVGTLSSAVLVQAGSADARRSPGPTARRVRVQETNQR